MGAVKAGVPRGGVLGGGGLTPLGRLPGRAEWRWEQSLVFLSRWRMP